MQPRESKRYEELRSSVENLSTIIGGKQSLLTKAKANNLEDLYILAVAPKLAMQIKDLIQAGKSAEEISVQLENTMIVQTDLLSGLQREDEGVISEMLTHKIRNSKIAKRLADEALEKYGQLSDKELVTLCEDALQFAIRMQRLAK